MKKFYVYESDGRGKPRKISREEGFSDEASACAYALCQAAIRWNNYSVYSVISSAGDFVADYWGCGLTPAKEAVDALEIEEADNREEYFRAVRRAA